MSLTREPILIRDAEPDDLPAILTIYNDVILTTTAVYSEEPTSLDERRRWYIDRRAAGLPVLVAARGGEVLGFGSFGGFRPWPCYAQSVEHSLHVAAGARRQGVGHQLLASLIDRAAAMDMHVMVAGIDSGNAASIALHLAFGFEHAGTIREVGRKFGRWLDLSYMRKELAPSPAHKTAAAGR